MGTPNLSALNVDSLVRRIQAAQSILLTTHKQCDGDGLGALLALYHGLRKSGKKVRALLVDAVPKKYVFLEPERHLEVFEAPHAPIEETDLTLVFDTNDRRLVDPLFTALKPKCREILFVDHHPVLTEGPEPTPGSFIDTRAASTGEISYFLIKNLGIRLDERIAQALYTSICFDTQLFKFVKNSVNSHLIAAEMLMHINNAEDIHRHLFATHTVQKVAFLAKVLGQIEYFGNGQVAVLKLHAQTLSEHSLDMDDSRDVIDMIMNVNTLQAAALFREDAPNEYKLSLRSKGRIEVLGVAEAFQGGGHMFAAGAPLKGNYTQLKEKSCNCSSPVWTTHMKPEDKNPKRTRLICLCNAVPQDKIEAAIERGCTTLSKVFDATTAGVGPCGGTCQPILRKMLDSYLGEGKFPEDPRPVVPKRRRR